MLGEEGAEALPSPGRRDDEATQFLAPLKVTQLAAGDGFALVFDQPELLPASEGRGGQQGSDLKGTKA